ncbi:MucR family transcriptional regulator [Methylobacterium sp. E-046]|nr:MucR family transcriptional regulator [Methylobacterium sp. E-046]MCJ2099300.1 MucR family transcriptional regulator [Methylobacterium sp. E-046]
MEAGATDYTGLTTNLVSAYVSNNRVPPAELPALIASMHAALGGLGRGDATQAPPTQKLTAAQIRKSITPDALISFIDGKPYKTLKRHLTVNGMTIEQYRERYGLPRDYPSTAASYSAMRAEFARNAGLGRNRKKAAPKAAEPAEIVADKPKRAGRPRKAKEAAEA